MEMAQSGLNSAEISQDDFRILMTKVAPSPVLISFPQANYSYCTSLKLMNTLEMRNSSRESLPENVPISQFPIS